MPIDYTNTTVTGYNTSPPVDDGTESEANRTRWATIKEKLADPLKTAIGSIDTQVQTSFGSIPTLTGTKSIWVSAQEFSAAGVTTTTSGNTSITHVLLTDSATTDYQHFNVVMPESWDEGDLDITLYFLQHLTGSGVITIEVSGAALADDETMTGLSYGSAVQQDITIPGTQYDYFKSETFTVSGTWNDGEMVIIQIYRNYGDAEDTYGDTIGLLGAKVSYTTNAVTDD